jgi:hypothetical protein
MAKEWCDWTDLMKGDVGEPDDPMSKPVVKDSHKGGEKVTKEDLKKDVDFILEGFRAQGVASPTKDQFETRIKQMYPELNKTDAEWDQVEKEWENTFNTFFDGNKTKVGDKEPVEYGTGESFRDRLSKAEREKYDAEEKAFNEASVR